MTYVDGATPGRAAYELLNDAMGLVVPTMGLVASDAATGRQPFDVWDFVAPVALYRWAASSRIDNALEPQRVALDAGLESLLGELADCAQAAQAVWDAPVGDALAGRVNAALERTAQLRGQVTALMQRAAAERATAARVVSDPVESAAKSVAGGVENAAGAVRTVGALVGWLPYVLVFAALLLAAYLAWRIWPRGGKRS